MPRYFLIHEFSFDTAKPFLARRLHTQTEQLILHSASQRVTTSFGPDCVAFFKRIGCTT